MKRILVNPRNGYNTQEKKNTSKNGSSHNMIAVIQNVQSNHTLNLVYQLQRFNQNHQISKCRIRIHVHHSIATKYNDNGATIQQIIELISDQTCTETPNQTETISTRTTRNQWVHA